MFVEILTLPCRIALAGCISSWEELETDDLSKERDEQHVRSQDGVSDPSLDIGFLLELLASGQEQRFCLCLQYAEVSHYFMMYPQVLKVVVPCVCHTDLTSAYRSLKGSVV